MIMCFEGTPGSGKSYDAVRKILDNLKLKRIVYTNIDGFEIDECREMIRCVTGLDDYQLKNYLRFLPNSQVSTFYSDIELGSLIVIDEAQNFFNARKWQSQENEGFARWSSTHRHYGFDVVLITQNIERIDAAVRSLCEWTYRYKKLNFFGSLIGNKYMCHAFSGDASGKPLSRLIRSYDHKIFRCYKSYVSKDVKELGIMKHANILKHPIFYALPVVLVVFLFFFFKSGFSKGNVIPGSGAIQTRQSVNDKDKKDKPVSVNNVVAVRYGKLADKRVVVNTLSNNEVQYILESTGKSLPKESIPYVVLDVEDRTVKNNVSQGVVNAKAEVKHKREKVKVKYRVQGIVTVDDVNSSVLLVSSSDDSLYKDKTDLERMCGCDVVLGSIIEL